MKTDGPACVLADCNGGIRAFLNGDFDPGWSKRADTFFQAEADVFKISRSSFPGTYVPGSLERGETDFELLHQFCHTEGWSGDLSNGLFKLGEKTAHMHGLSQRDCGLLNLIRCYDPADRTHVLELFEQAATASSSFCYSTTILLADGGKQPVFCIGESSGLEQRYSGMILGTFLFPRFQVTSASRLPLRQ